VKSHLHVRREAETDVASAWAWYESRRAGLGEDFLLCLDAALGRVLRAPEAFPYVHRDIRRVLVRRFPYAVFYLTEPSRIVVLAVLHCHRESEIWKGRR
jgi:plasmid stabilization system protein ParE